MAGQKRQAGASETPAAKRSKGDSQQPEGSGASQPRPVFTSALLAEEGDFPRGGGTNLTQFEYKQVRDEGRQEAERDVEAERKKRKAMQNRRKKGKDVEDKKGDAKDKEAIREQNT